MFAFFANSHPDHSLVESAMTADQGESSVACHTQIFPNHISF